jgi:enoyl-CoA hydratase/carnithine racemase
VNPTPETSASLPLLTIADRTATILLRRPQQHNRIDPDDLPVLLNHLDLIEACADVTC